MSGPITAEQITEGVFECVCFETGTSEELWPARIAEIANGLIKAGIANKPNKWVEITDDPETWPPEKKAVLVWDTLEIRIAFYDKDEWFAPLRPYLKRNKKIGWDGRRALENQRVFMWRPI